MSEVNLIIAVVSAVVGATWLLRSKLSDIERALEGHTGRANERHDEHERRIVSLEEYRNGRR